MLARPETRRAPSRPSNKRVSGLSVGGAARRTSGASGEEAGGWDVERRERKYMYHRQLPRINMRTFMAGVVAAAMIASFAPTPALAVAGLVVSDLNHGVT